MNRDDEDDRCPVKQHSDQSGPSAKDAGEMRNNSSMHKILTEECESNVAVC